ncbi:lamin tail domain-containing protein [Pseudalkalibacillus berkeleyi]|uniref:Lamin tail domain-containing protein n=1 Tax=Pseudalkalibacillus berkeleyi TaxID=1069813 RepID=A0ABS9H185_9BACL|nr:lamin tail domain-containing protein [Pseudalkalibacillus berkeleyi]MCF6137700.1 lamin tail domain-containing protein [Pseudalkalibacillus berkeleyi]
MYQKKWNMFSLLSVFILSMASIFSPISMVDAEGPSDPAPFISPVGTDSGKKILFDNTHGQTAGAADWVIDGAFSDFANAIANEGHYVKELRKSTPITLDDLSTYDVFVVGEANIPYKTSEQAAMLQYVQNGGSIFFIADHYNADRNKNRFDSSEIFNGYRRGAWSNPTKGMSSEEASSSQMQDVTGSDWLSDNFGVRFRYNALGNVTANDIVAPDQAFGITTGVSTVAMHAGSTLAVTDPNKAKGIVYLPQTSAKWTHAVDQGVYNGGGREEGPYVAVSKVGQGKAAFIGDSSPVEDATPKYQREETGSSKTTYDGFTEQDDATLLTNLIDWLSVQENYTNLTQVSGLQLDQPTTLLAMEDPQSSTEPEAEPWASPDPGYKWYDSTTFKAGSYGYASSPGGGGTTEEEVYVSEYVEGSGYNKALEIFNGSTTSIDLSSYSIELSNITGSIPLSGTLASGDVYVIANPNASPSILAVADAQNSSVSFNGDDAVSLKHNGVLIDQVGTAGVTYGQDVTLVRDSAVTTGSSTYASSQWSSYSTDTFTYLGSHNGAVSSTPVISEDFESGSKGSYTTGTVATSSGTWTFTNALLGNLSSDKKYGTQSARIKSAGSISMEFDVSSAKEVVFSHANFNNDSGATWKLQKSTNQGATWIDVTSYTTSGSTLTEETIPVNVSSTVRFRIMVSGTSGERINIDDFKVLD